MKTYKMKRVVVGIMLVILTLGFCVVGTGAAHADQMGGPMGRQQGFGPGGQGGPMDQMGFGSGNQGFGPGGSFGSDMQDFSGSAPDGQTAPDGGDSFPGNFGQGMDADANGHFSPDGGFGPGGQRDFGGHGGFGRDGGPQKMDNDVRKAIDGLEDADTKAALETLMDNVHTAMEALHDADDDTREAAETDVKEARDALNEALTAAGIQAQMNEPPAKPEGDDGANGAKRPEFSENSNLSRPKNGGMQNAPDFLSREALENIDLDDEEQVQDLFQQFVTWLKDSNNT